MRTRKDPTRGDIKSIKDEANRIREKCAYMDNMPLDGWFWEIIRRTQQYQSLCDKIATFLGPISKEESDIIDKQLEDIGVRYLGYEQGDLWIPLPSYLTPEYEKIPDDGQEIQTSDIVFRECDHIPRPEFSYCEICEYYEKNWGMKPPPIVEGVHPNFQIKEPDELQSNINYFKHLLSMETMSACGVGTFIQEKDYIDSVINLVMRITFGSNYDNALILCIDKNAKIKEVEELLIPKLRKYLKSSKPKLRTKDKWKFYLIIYDLKTKHSTWSYDYLADIINGAFPPTKTFLAFDARTVQNHYKQALLLINGDYKRYLY